MSMFSDIEPLNKAAKGTSTLAGLNIYRQLHLCTVFVEYHICIWLQLGWASPCEVTKNLVDLVPLVLGHGVIQPFQWLMSTCTGSPKPPKT